MTRHETGGSFDELVRRLFLEALALPEGERDPYLEGSGAGPPVVEEVRSLLRHAPAGTTFLDDARGLGDVLDGSTALAQLVDLVAEAWPDDPEPYADTGLPAVPRHRDLRLIRHGSHGPVYRAKREAVEGSADVCLLSGIPAEGALGRALEEQLAAVSRLDLPGIPRILDHGETADGSSWFSTPPGEGHQLLRWARRGELGAWGRVELVARVCEILSPVHAAGLGHGHLGPDQVLVAPSGDPWVLGLGLARIPPLAVPAARAHGAGRPPVPPLLAAPEQVAGASRVDVRRSDVHALGLILHELLAGRFPYPSYGRPHGAAVAVVVQQLPEPLHAQAVARVQRVLDRCLAKDPGDRYADAGELATALRRCLTASTRVTRDRPEGHRHAFSDTSWLVGDDGRRFLLFEKLSEDAAGQVFRAHGEGELREASLRISSSPLREERSEFDRLVRLLDGLQHEGISALQGSGVAPGGRPWFALEHSEGERPLAWAERTGRAPLACATIAAQLADALDHGHRRGVLHRDLRDEHVVVGTGGRPQLEGHAHARLLQAGHLARLRAGQDVIEDALARLAPEQAAGRRGDARSDQWALGVLLHEMLCGRPPHALDGLRPDRVLEARSHPVPPLVEIAGPDLASVLARALEVDPDDRYPTVAEMATDLRRVVRGEAPSTLPRSRLQSFLGRLRLPGPIARALP